VSSGICMSQVIHAGVASSGEFPPAALRRKNTALAPPTGPPNAARTRQRYFWTRSACFHRAKFAELAERSVLVLHHIIDRCLPSKSMKVAQERTRKMLEELFRDVERGEHRSQFRLLCSSIRCISFIYLFLNRICLF